MEKLRSLASEDSVLDGEVGTVIDEMKVTVLREAQNKQDDGAATKGSASAEVKVPSSNKNVK